MKADGDGVMDSFGGVPAIDYHGWRLESELYRTVESPILSPLLETIPFRRALDVGCGTGIWTCFLKRLRPESEIVGIDIASDMIGFARRECPARFEAVDALRFRDSQRFDLVISALSADYIGFPGFFSTVAANLASDGIAYAWFLDPSRYPYAGDHRVKTWDIRGRQVQVEIPDYDVARIAEISALAGLQCSIVSTPFRLRDLIHRNFLCIRCARDYSELSNWP